MTEGSVNFRNSVFRYYQWGSGARLLVGLHGFGENAQSFASLGAALDQRFTLFAIDLPLHGGSHWNEPSLPDGPSIFDMLDTIPIIGTSAFTLLGFSMGGRVALSLYQHRPERIEALLLLAPDGLLVNPWYWFSTQTQVGNRLFRYAMYRPEGFFGFMNILRHFGWLNESVFKFCMQFLRTPSQRQQVYSIWTLMREFKPDLREIKRLIRVHRTSLTAVFGRYDRIFRYRNGFRLRKGVERYCTINLVETGHQILQERTGAELVDLLTHTPTR